MVSYLGFLDEDCISIGGRFIPIPKRLKCVSEKKRYSD